jgi:hypothetical protein
MRTGELLLLRNQVRGDVDCLARNYGDAFPVQHLPGCVTQLDVMPARSQPKFLQLTGGSCVPAVHIHPRVSVLRNDFHLARICWIVFFSVILVGPSLSHRVPGGPV